MNDLSAERLCIRAFELFARRWVVPILRTLMESPLGFNELRRAISDISAYMLNERLRELVSAGLVEREVQLGPPVRTIYALTPAGEGIRPFAQALMVWHRSLPPDAVARLVAASRGRVPTPPAQTALHPHTFRLLGRRWAVPIVLRLLDGPLGFNDLRRSIAAIPERVMATRLRELVEAGLVERRVQAGPPLRTAYALTPIGEGLRPPAAALLAWASELSSAEAARLLNTETDAAKPEAGVTSEID